MKGWTDRKVKNWNVYVIGTDTGPKPVLTAEGLPRKGARETARSLRYYRNVVHAWAEKQEEN